MVELINILFYRNRVIQHYTSNPLKAFTGKMEKPLISINYILREDSEHNSECRTEITAS